MAKILFWLLISFCAAAAVLAAGLYFLKSPYLGWDLNSPEFTALATVFHVSEWLFSRIAPVTLIAALAGAFVIRKKA